MSAIAEGKYDEGIQHLETAYDILPHPNVLYNLGLAHMYAGRPEDALDFFTRYKDTAPPADAIEVDALIRSLQATPAPGPVAEPTTPTSEVSNEATIASVEAAAAEIRRLAEEQNSDALRKQADDLDNAARTLRDQTAAAGEQPTETPATEPKEPGEIPEPTGQTSTEGKVAQQTPPATLPGQAAAQTGVYEEQVISASRFSQSPLDAPNATAIITAQDIRMSGVLQLSQLLRRIAGVEVMQVSPSHAEVSIRGLNRRSSNKLMILVDGRSVRKEFFGTNWPDILPVTLDEIERVEIIRGPASALYGADAFAGVINVITRAPGKGDSFVAAKFGNKGQASAAITVNGRRGPAAYRFSTGYLATNNTVLIADPARVDVKNFSDTPNRANNGTSTSGEVALTLAPRTVATVGGSYTAGDVTVQGLSRQGQITVDDSYDAYAWMSLTTPVGLRLGAWYNKQYADSGTSYYTPGSFARSGGALDQDQAEADLSYTQSFKALFDQMLTVGATYRFKRITWDWFEQDNSQHHIGVYLQDVVQLAKPLRLQIGARIDRHPLLDNVQFSPRGSLVYRFLGEQSVRLSAARAFRGPAFLESYMRVPNESPLRGVSAFGIGNENLDPESITSFELGYQNQESDYFTLETNVYFNLVKDAILLTDIERFTVSDYAGGNSLAAYQPNDEAFPVSSLKFANERATFRQVGAELGIRLFPVQGLDYYANYSIHDTRPTDKDKVDEARAEEAQTSRHKVNTGIQYRADFGLELSADYSWTSKQVWVEQVIDTDRGVRWEDFDIKSLSLLNARIGWRLLNERLELGVVGTNLTNQKQRVHPLVQPLDTRYLATAKVWF